MAKKIQSKNKPLSENYFHSYKGKGGFISVAVHINYAEGYISLIDANPKNPAASTNNGKQWKFANRELRFMTAWQDILSAMKSAIAEATERLQEYTDQEEKEAIEFAVAVQEGVDKKK